MAGHAGAVLGFRWIDIPGPARRPDQREGGRWAVGLAGCERERAETRDPRNPSMRERARPGVGAATLAEAGRHLVRTLAAPSAIRRAPIFATIGACWQPHTRSKVSVETTGCSWRCSLVENWRRRSRPTYRLSMRATRSCDSAWCWGASTACCLARLDRSQCRTACSKRAPRYRLTPPPYGRSKLDSTRWLLAALVAIFGTTMLGLAAGIFYLIIGK